VIAAQPWTLPLRLVFALWVIVLCDPQIWLVAQGVSFAPRIVLALYGTLGAMVLAHAPPVSRWYPAFLLYLANACVMLPFAENTGVARDFVLKNLLLYYLLAVGSLTFIQSVAKARLLLLLPLLQSGGSSRRGSPVPTSARGSGNRSPGTPISGTRTRSRL